VTFYLEIVLMDKLITQQEAADLLGVSKVSLWRLRRKMDFSTFEIGGRTQYDRGEILRFIESQRLSGPKPVAAGASS
jgi:hypothetical protein